MADLQEAFNAFARYGAGQTAKSDMTSKNFNKAMKDSGLHDKKECNDTDLDLIFTKVKAKGAKTINFTEFQAALQLVADKRKITLDAAKAKVAAASPTSNATQAEYNKFHDDKSTYTGVYAAGGPTNVDKDKQGLAAHLDRSEADVRGVKKSLH